MSQTPSSPSAVDEIVAKAKYKHFISSEDRTDGGPGFWLISDRPFEEAATDMLRSAVQACKQVPSVLGNYTGIKHTPI